MRILPVAAACVVCGVWAADAWADKIEMVGGGFVEGRILGKDGDGVTIKSSAGTLKIPHARIRKILYEPSALEQYERTRKLYRDTADDQYRLGLWCGRAKLYKQRDQHWRRAVELDPNHALARKALGHHLVDGRWVTHDEKMQAQGFVRYKGKWLLPEQKALAVEREALEGKRRRLFQKVRSVILGFKRGRYKGDQRRALSQLLSLADPLATEPLVSLLSKESQTLRLLLVEALNRVNTDEAIVQLVRLSVLDKSDEVADHAANLLVRRGDPEIAQLYVRFLTPKAGDAMRRAAAVVGDLGNVALVPRLIGLLRTKEKVVREVRGRGMTTSSGETVVRGFRPASRTGNKVVLVPRVQKKTSSSSLRAGAVAKKVVTVTRSNPEVLDALVQLSGQNFGFDENAWKTWWANQELKLKAKHRAAPGVR